MKVQLSPSSIEARRRWLAAQDAQDAVLAMPMYGGRRLDDFVDAAGMAAAAAPRDRLLAEATQAERLARAAWMAAVEQDGGAVCEHCSHTLPGGRAAYEAGHDDGTAASAASRTSPNCAPCGRIAYEYSMRFGPR